MRRRKGKWCPKCTRAFSPRKEDLLPFHIQKCSGLSRGGKLRGKLHGTLPPIFLT